LESIAFVCVNNNNNDGRAEEAQCVPHSNDAPAHEG
jgi:hypothetical protein